MKKFKFITPFLTLMLCIIAQFSFAQTTAALAPNAGISDALSNQKCGTMPGVLQRVANDPAYAAIYNQHRSDLDAGVFRSADPCATPIVVPVAFHFDETFSCADPECLVREVEESLATVNESFADNTQTDLVQALNMACPSEYPLSDISTGTCISFCLAEPRAAFSNQGLDPACDPSITIGSFCGGNNYCGDVDGGAPPYYGGILNIFIVGGDGTGLLGVADGIPGAANGDGVTVLGSVFGSDGNGCISGGPLNTSGLFGGGATLAHEIGHYLGLFHIWADDGGGCTFDDGISDTPQQGDNNQNLFPCPTVGTTCTGLPQSCGSYDYYHNFMDYTSDNCLVMFTQEQAQVMNSTANTLFGTTSATCDTDPIVLTSLCEQTVCDPACDFTADITAACDADGLNYTVTITITGGTGPFDVNETADNEPTTVETVLATGLAAGTYTYSFPAGTNSNVVVVDNGIADCFDGQFIFNPCAMCDFTIEFDYDNVTCNDFGGTLLATVPIIVTPSEPGSSIVWIDQDGNTTFDAADIDITNGGNIGFPSSDLTFIIYDSGAEDCFATYTVESGSFSCDRSNEGEPALRVCTFTSVADEVDYTCNGDGTATVEIVVDKIAGNLTVLTGNATQTSIVGDEATYDVIVPVGAGCATTTVTFADDGSDISEDSGVSITAPANITNMITNVGYNVDGDDADTLVDFGIDIATVIPPVCGTLAQPNDGTDPASDFCEPTPPAIPTAAQCAAISGNIAIIDRGTCAFTVKIENAQACGATAVIICNCDANLADCNSENNDQVSGMVGTSVNPITIPTIFLSYNQCQQIYVNLNDGPVDMCIGAPMPVPCERTVNIDGCVFVCDDQCTDLGCTDDTACNFDPIACEDNGTCLPVPVCNTDPCVGDIQIEDPNDACVCITDVPQVLGCTDATACNFNAEANCDDGNCDAGNAACTDPCSPVNGCTDATACNFDADACVDDGSCVAAPCNPGCTNACATNFDANADADDGSCMFPSADDGCALTTDSYDDVNCVVINEAPDTDDGCALTTDAFDAATCTITNTPNCAADETFDNVNCLCEVVTCENSISGSVTTDEPNCSLAGFMVEILDAAGNPVAGSPATVDASGNYTLVGPFPCGTYTATLVESSLLECYTNIGGTTGPIEFVVDGDGTADGANFSTIMQVPTLSQWGLISLALLLMIFGAVKISATSLWNEKKLN